MYGCGHAGTESGNLYVGPDTGTANGGPSYLINAISPQHFTYTDAGNLYVDNVAEVSGTAYVNGLYNDSAERVCSVNDNSGTISDDGSEVFFVKTNASAATLTLASYTVGRKLYVKDYSGSAATNNITINTPGSETIDGAASYVINANYGSVQLIENPDGN